MFKELHLRFVILVGFLQSSIENKNAKLKTAIVA